MPRCSTNTTSPTEPIRCIKIDLTGNDGPDGDGFTLDNIGAVGDELIAGQILKVDLDGDSDSRVGILDDALEGTEGGVLVFDVNIRQDEVDASAVWILFKSLNDDSGSEADDMRPADIDLTPLALGNYRIAIKLPTNDDDADKAWTAIFGHGAGVTTLLGVTPVTIRDSSYEAPTDAPVEPESSFDTVLVTATDFKATAENPILHHNISNVLVTKDGVVLPPADFLTFYNATGGLDRWGHPSSELVEIETGTLTQFFQRGALALGMSTRDLVTRLNADWLGTTYGGGLGGSTDQMVSKLLLTVGP